MPESASTSDEVARRFKRMAAVELKSPLDGVVLPLEQVPDPVFANMAKRFRSRMPGLAGRSSRRSTGRTEDHAANRRARLSLTCGCFCLSFPMRGGAAYPGTRSRAVAAPVRARLAACRSVPVQRDGRAAA
jgi:hypothetical protein